jgi:hypothetical protein
MNYCPECGKRLMFDKLERDVPTDHYCYTCCGSGRHRWEETMDRSGTLLHIAPIKDAKEG